MKSPNLDLDSLLGIPNIAELLDTTYLTELGVLVFEDYTKDEQSRVEWIKSYEEAMKIASQICEKKSYPWQGASNVLFPLITIGAMQFHARAYPALLPSKGVVQVATMGLDPTGEKYLLSKLVAAHMKYQFEYEMKDWEEGMDKLLITLPITGCEFKKTYFDPQKGANCSEYVRSTDLVVNYYAKSLEEASRKTHIITLDRNELIEFQRAKLFLDISLGFPEPRSEVVTKITDSSSGFSPHSEDSATPYKILEWHGFLDLDGDGYKEPYIVTIDHGTQTVLRVVARFYKNSILRGLNSEVLSIKPIEHFTQYNFIPNPTGGIYGIGFGKLLGPINHSINTIINQLIDSGTLSNMQSGFISRSLRIKNGDMAIRPGFWQEVNGTGSDLKNGVFPLPLRDPSPVLLQLLERLISSGEILNSSMDMMVGENPGQNQKATTSQLVYDQGMKVFTAIFKRIRKSMAKEFEKVFALNFYFLDEEKTKLLFDGQVGMKREMYDPNKLVVYPSADPNLSSFAERSGKIRMLLELMQTGGFNEYEIKRRAVESLDIENPEMLLMPPEQDIRPPDPKLVKAQGDLQEQDFRRKLDTIELMHSMKKDEKELEIKEEHVATERLKAMLDGFAKGADVSTKNRALAQKEISDRRRNASN